MWLAFLVPRGVRKPREKPTNVKPLAAHPPIFGLKTRRFLTDVASAGARLYVFCAAALCCRPVLPPCAEGLTGLAGFDSHSAVGLGAGPWAHRARSVLVRASLAAPAEGTEGPRPGSYGCRSRPARRDDHVRVLAPAPAPEQPPHAPSSRRRGLWPRSRPRAKRRADLGQRAATQRSSLWPGQNREAQAG